MVAGPLLVNAYQSEGRVVIELDGELDLYGSPRLLATARQFLSLRPDGVDIDATSLTFIDSSGLQAFFVARREAADAGIGLRVIKASACVDRVFEMTGAGPTLRGDGL